MLHATSLFASFPATLSFVTVFVCRSTTIINFTSHTIAERGPLESIYIDSPSIKTIFNFVLGDKSIWIIRCHLHHLASALSWILRLLVRHYYTGNPLLLARDHLLLGWHHLPWYHSLWLTRLLNLHGLLTLHLRIHHLGFSRYESHFSLRWWHLWRLFRGAYHP